MLSLIFHLNSLRFMLPAVGMLGVSPAFLTLWVPFKVLSTILPKRFFVRVDDSFYSFYQRLVLFYYEHYTGIQLVLYGDAEEIMKKKENIVYMSNHQCTVDWIVADMVSVRQGSLGHLRYILKDGLRYFPLYGYYFEQHGSVYIKRAGKFQEARTVKNLERLKDMPFWLVVFPEGTRYNPENPNVIAKSQEFAQSRDLAVLEHVLTPRFKATCLCIQTLREEIDAVYDVTVAYSNTNSADGKRRTAPSMPDFLQKVSPQVHVHVARIDIKDIPEDEEKLKSWMMERYVFKEQLLKRFYSDDPAVSGTLDDKGVVSPLPLKNTLPALLFWTSYTSLLLATSSGRSLYWRISVFGTLSLLGLMAIRS
ncbi:1-acyl-sn-glycerol-3-phosphate acyltransferase epsilon-like [Lineus longissimus]|uniref:1-acyl-sn-glycerol-3-phosphate acyltransferase epsilon-like n=1 Tax=Lineus longissimus TaxID=88925 RepID=UPI002B4F6D27